MSRKVSWPPKIYVYGNKEKLRLRTGGVVRDITLGPAGSALARAEYLRIVAEMEATGTAQAGPPDFTVAMLADWHLQWAEKRYERRQYARVKTALNFVVQLYGHTPARAFGPVALETVRAAFVAAGYCRKLCNRMTDCVRWAWRRAAAKELVPTPVADALYSLAGLRKRDQVGEVVVFDHPNVPPVDDAILEQTLPVLGAIVADMVRLQRLTGMRPGEVCALRPGDIERPWRTIDGVAMWVYKLDEHKNDWRGHQRWVPIGPQAQALLAPYLERAPSAYCFSPAEARQAWEAAKRAARKSKVQPSQESRRKKNPKKKPGGRYSTCSYGRAIARACKTHGILHWAPNQIRHQVLEQIEAEHDQEDARCVAGHTTATTTALYTRGVLRAGKVLAKLG